MPDAISKTATTTSRPGRARAPHRIQVPQRLAAWIFYGLERSLGATWRIRWVDRSGLFQAGGPKKPVIFCLWHNRLALAMIVHRTHVRRFHPQRPLAALVSASKDGALLSALLERFGVRPVRGSSSRRGAQALLELAAALAQGCDVAITPDGPRGPRYVVQPGILTLAQLTGCPIVPVSGWIERKWTLRSWDGFQIPRLFSRCEVVLEKPVPVPRDISETERETLRQTLTTTLMSITRD